MARANTITQLSLDRFFQILGIHPLHGNQVGLPSEVNFCGNPIMQYSWQVADRVGREEIAMAIYDAERMISDYTHFDIGLRWNVDEQYIGRGVMKASTNRKYVVSSGRQKSTLLASNVVVTYSDTDGDGYKETATMTFSAISDVLEDEIAIFYPGKDEKWRIRPITVTVNHVTFLVTVVARREQLVIPSAMEALDVRDVIGTDDANFLGTVDLWRIYNDDTTQLSFIGPGILGTDVEVSGYTDVINARLGTVSLHYSNNCYTTNCLGFPDRIRMYYRAGLTQDIDQWERATAYLALSLLDRPICTCASLEHVSRHWQEDLALVHSTQSSSSHYIVNNRRNLWLDNPFGTTRAGVFVWNLVERRGVGEYA